jgi:uncharacterized membrane protein YcaP (DUF421 family)
VDIVWRAAAMVVLLFLITRVIGRRELASMAPFDIILLVVTGDLIQQGVTQSDYSMTGAALAVSTIALLAVAISYLSFRVRRLRPLLEGEPIVLVENGRIIEANLRRERITVEELAAEARQNEIADLEEIRWAVLETSGKISFIPASSE